MENYELFNGFTTSQCENLYDIIVHCVNSQNYAQSVLKTISSVIQNKKNEVMREMKNKLEKYM